MDKQYIELATYAAKMKELSETILENVDEKMKEMQEREEKLKKLDQQLEDNANKLKNKVVLDVGGKKFATSADTLLAHKDTYFSALLQNDRFKPAEDGSYFIDRNPKYFTIILEYLRTGKLCVSHLNKEQILNLHTEFEYYQLPTKGLPENVEQSHILNASQIKILVQWISKPLENLLWRGSEHGFQSDQFHKCCDNKGPTVVVAKSTNGFVFGGYAHSSWPSKCYTDYSFLFTLVNPYDKPPTKFYFNYPQAMCEPPYESTNGPNFGDLVISSNSASFSYPKYFNSDRYDPSKFENLFAGSNNVSLTEVEVYSVKE